MKISLNNILAPTDFSVAGNNALRTAVELCKQHRAVLHLMYVLESRYIVATPQSDLKMLDNGQDLNQQARNRLYAEYESIIKTHGIPVQIHLPTGIPYDEICKTAAEMPIDLIVLGTNRAPGENTNAVGTTCYNVIKNTVKAVITVPVDFKFSGFKKILFPVRPVHGIREKYEFIKRFCDVGKAEMHIAMLSLEDENDLLFADSEDLSEVISSWEDTGVSFTSESHACKNYSSKVLELTETLDTELIAINATLYYNWIEFFLGPYTLQIINNAKVPVLCFRQGIDILPKHNIKTKETRVNDAPLASL